MTRSHRRDTTQLLLGLAFGSIALVLVATDVITALRLREVQREVHNIVENELASIQWVERMRNDIDDVRLLLESHILADTPSEWDHIEQEIADADADFDEAARRYAPLADLPGEPELWAQFQNDVAAIRRQLPGILAASRRNRDGEATAAHEALEGQFVVLERDAHALTEINGRQVLVSGGTINALQRSAIQLSVALGVLGLLIVLAIGITVSMLLTRRQQRIHAYAGELEARNRDLDAFAGRVAHDLRGPLTTISMAADTLLRKMPEEREIANLLRRGVSRTEALITDLLALSRIDAYARLQHSNPAAVSAQLAEEVAPRLAAEHATLHVAVEPSSVVGSDGLLRQALWNLTDNALRYARPEVPPEIEIAGRASDGQYELTFTDNGVGMSDEEARQAFEPFFRGESSREKPGTGLGLSIVKRVMEANGGSVSVSSTRGRGTRFTLRLPTT